MAALSDRFTTDPVLLWPGRIRGLPLLRVLVAHAGILAVAVPLAIAFVDCRVFFLCRSVLVLGHDLPELSDEVDYDVHHAAVKRQGY